MWRSFHERYTVKMAQDPNPKMWEKVWDEVIERKMSERDKKLFADPEERAMLVVYSREAWRQGTVGWVKEAKLQGKNWGFQLTILSLRG
jgi:hypothetical protein